MDFTINPLNGIFFIALSVFVLILVISAVLLRKKSEKVKETVLVTAMFLTLALFIWYKIMLFFDKDYSDIRVNTGLAAFNWWMELPLQLCNINMILIPISVLTKNKALQGFCFFVGPLGAVMALLMPSVGFKGYSLFLPRNIGYYGTHFMVLIGGIALAAFGIYKPTFKSVLPAFFMTLFIAAAVFLINMILRWTGAAPRANYFYCVETDNNPILNLFYSWIPVPFLYTLPCGVLILLPYMLLLTFAFYLGRKIGAKKKGAAT